MKDNKRHPLANIVDFSGPRAWISKTTSVMNELEKAIYDLDAFESCYPMFSPKDVLPNQIRGYAEDLKFNVIDKLSELYLMLDGLSIIYGADKVEERRLANIHKMFSRFEEELNHCVAVAEYMKELKERLNGDNNSKPR